MESVGIIGKWAVVGGRSIEKGCPFEGKVGFSAVFAENLERGETLGENRKKTA